MDDPLPGLIHAMCCLARSHGPLPRYGDDDWHALEQDDPRRLAAVYLAAECWRQEGVTEALEARLLADLDTVEETLHWRMRQGSWDLSAARDWGRPGMTWEQLQDARAGR